MPKVALYIGRCGAGLRPCMSAARHLRATTVTVLGVETDGSASQAIVMAQLLRRFAEGEFDGVLAWLDEYPAARLCYIARKPSWPFHDRSHGLCQSLTITASQRGASVKSQLNTGRPQVVPRTCATVVADLQHEENR